MKGNERAGRKEEGSGKKSGNEGTDDNYPEKREREGGTTDPVEGIPRISGSLHGHDGY